MRTFYYKDRFLGGSEISAFNFNLSEAESSFSRASLAFVSPTDGETWARSPVLDGQRVMPFFVLTKPGLGEGHRASYGPSGSLMSAGSWMLNQLSPQALRAEVLIHCDWYMSRPTTLESLESCLK